MKAVEFQTVLNPNRTLTVPEEAARTIPEGTEVRVLVLIAESESTQAWERMAAMEFGQGYADTDTIYDQLSRG